MKISLKELKDVLSAEVSEGTDLDLVVDTALSFFDSRKLSSGSFFVAIKSDKNDGALYIKDAYNKGAVAAVSQSNPDNLPNVLIVKDSVKAYQMLGSYVRSKYKGFVVGITGSSGKTTSKAIVAQMLSAFGTVFLGDPAFNNHIGTPYNLCRLDLNSKYAVFEMGMDHAGEISALVNLVAPNLAAITNVYPMHIEYFNEFKEIAYAKAEIFEKVIPYNGQTWAVINQDTNFADEVLKPQAQKSGINNIITFGKNGDVSLFDCSFNSDGHTEVQIKIADKIYKHIDQGLGERYAYNACFALAVASALNLDITKALQAISSFEPLKGRGKVTRINIKSDCPITLIDDSYNGQPEAMRQAIQTLSLMRRKSGARKIALIGRMMELGDSSTKEHQSVGDALAESDIDIVIGVGPETKYMLERIPETKTAIFKQDITGVFDELMSLFQPEDIIMIKGSHYASRVFEVAEALLKFNS